MTKQDHTPLKRRTRQIVAALARAFGDDEHYDEDDPLDCLVHCILSQNTTSANCREALSRLRERFPTWEEVMAARTTSIAAAIKVGGLANQKSVWIKAALKSLYQEHGKLSLECLHAMGNEEVIDSLTSLKGVGLKTAAIVLCFACRRDVFPVDTHVHRLCKRLGLVSAKATREQTFWDMAPLVPPGKANSFHINLVHLGREICKARKPQCGECPLDRLCGKVGVEA